MENKTIYPTINQLLLSFGIWIILSAGFRFFAFNMFFYNALLGFVKWYLELFSILFGVIYQEYPSSDNIISLNGASLKIIYECTAYSYYIFIISMVSFSPWKTSQKIWGGVIILIITTVLNATRFFSVAWIIRKHPQHLDIFHDYVWNILFAVIIFLTYLLFHYYFFKKNQNNSIAA